MCKEFNPLVTFIVPCYNVEQYIENCINSILKQTYRNLEVIPVDDGSPDKSGDIIDRMAVADNRIKPLHKKNGGVSSARNAGIEVATGEYIVFVDGDDYLSADYTEYMLGLILSNDSDFALSLNCFTSNGEQQVGNERISVYTPEEATSLLLGPRVIVGCWNKIFKKKLLLDNDIRFSKTQFYGEGLIFITTVSQLAKSIVVGNRKVYYYRRNNYSSACTKFNINNFYNGSASIDYIEKTLKIKSAKVLGMLNYHRCQFKMGTVVRLIEADKVNDFRDYYKECLRHVRNHTWKCLFLKGISLYKKGLLIGTCISPKMMAKLDIFRRNRITSKSI